MSEIREGRRPHREADGFFPGFEEAKQWPFSFRRQEAVRPHWGRPFQVLELRKRPLMKILIPHRSALCLGALACALPAALAFTSPATAALPASTPGLERSQLHWADFDGDGLQDAAAIDASGALRVLRNEGDGSLRDVSVESGLSGIAARFVLWGDADGDGRDELFVGTEVGASLLLRHEAGTFVDVAESLGVDHAGADLSADWLDYDQDARADLHVVTTAGHFLYHASDAGFERVDLTAATGLMPFVGPFVSGVLSPAARASDSIPTTDILGRPTRGSRAGSAGFGPAGPGSPGGTSALGGPFGPLCLPQIADDAGGACIRASRVPTLGQLFPLSAELNVAPAGNVGMGTTNPDANFALDIENFATGNTWTGAIAAGSSSGSKVVLGEHNGVATVGGHNGDLTQWRDLSLNPVSGNVGIGTGAPEQILHIQTNQAAALLVESSQNALLVLEADTNNDGSEIDHARIEYLQDGGGTRAYTGWAGGTNTFRIWSETTSTPLSFGTRNIERMTIGDDGLVSVKESLEIRGGADIVEGFDSSCGVIEPGTVVAIDPSSPGALMCSVEAYDTKVAGVVSGAGGVEAGIKLGQDGVLDGDTPVAMTGRVYVKCSTENGPIVPGDRLTTAALAGHAMKATDGARAPGAVIGKAMSALDADSGLVLVLVNLQ